MVISKGKALKIRNKKIAVVLGGGVNSLGVCRSLLRDDSIIIVSICHSTSVTRCLSRRIICINPREELLNCLLAINKLIDKAVCFPCGDKHLIFLIENRDKLTQFCIPFTNKGVIEKSIQLKICEESKTLFPKTAIIASQDGLDNLSELNYPLMIKPSRNEAGLFKAEIVNDDDTRNNLIKRCFDLDVQAVVAEYIPGGDEKLVTFGGYAYKGNILSFFTGRKRSQRPPLRGVACMAESYLINGIEKPSRGFISECEFSGIFQIEYKQHKETGEFYFIELNPRNWLWGFTATLSDRNFPVTKFYKEAYNQDKFENVPQKDRHFFIWIEAIIHNLIKNRSLNDVKTLLNLFSSKRPYFALAARWNIIPLLVSSINLLLYALTNGKFKR